MSEKPLLGLCMIVKDETKTIAATLASWKPYIDYWTVYDTWSTDGTPDLVQAGLEGIPGNLERGDFVDFSTARNRALDLHGDRTVFTVMPNGDALTNGKALVSFLEAHRESPQKAYNLRIEPGPYNLPLVLRAGCGWRYKWRTHEIPLGTDLGETIPGVTIVRDRSSRTTEQWRARWERDKKLLLEDVHANPTDARCWFYLAQTYECLGEYAAADGAYLRRATLAGHFDETYEALYRRAKMLVKQDKTWSEIEHAYLKAHAYDPRRAEPLVALAQHWHDQGTHALAYLYARRAAELPMPVTDMPGLEEDVYRTRATDLTAINAYYLRHLEPQAEVVGKQSADRTIAALPHDQRARHNAIFYAKSAKEVFGAKHKVIELPEGVVADGFNHAAPSVHFDGETWRALVRTVNYKIVKGDFVTPTGEYHTNNVWVVFDDHWNVTYAAPVIDNALMPRTAFPVHGFEDCRLIRWQDQWWASATCRDLTDHGRCEIVLLELGAVERSPEIVRVHRMIGPWSIEHQKNWMPIVTGKRLAFVYSVENGSRVVVDRGGDEAGGIRLGFESCGVARDFTPADLNSGRLRGGGQGVAVPGGGWLFCLHDVTVWPTYQSRTYLHRFVHTDDNLVMKSQSDLFFFEKLGIEFCGGLAIDNNRRLVASFHVNDEVSMIGVMDLDAVMAKLRPV